MKTQMIRNAFAVLVMAALAVSPISAQRTRGGESNGTSTPRSSQPSSPSRSSQPSRSSSSSSLRSSTPQRSESRPQHQATVNRPAPAKPAPAPSRPAPLKPAPAPARPAPAPARPAPMKPAPAPHHPAPVVHHHAPAPVVHHPAPAPVVHHPAPVAHRPGPAPAHLRRYGHPVYHKVLPTYHPIVVDNITYYWSDGHYYIYDPIYGYERVYCPEGVFVSSLPVGTTLVSVEGTAYYYYNGMYFLPVDNMFMIVERPMARARISVPLPAFRFYASFGF